MPPVPFKEFIAAGVDLCFYGPVDNAGIILGANLTPPVNGNPSGSGMRRLKAVQSITNNLPEGEAVPIPGDNGTEGQFLFAADETATFTIDAGVFSLVRDAMLQGTKTKRLGNSSITVGVMQPDSLDAADMCFIIQSPAKKFDAAQGSKAWMGYIIPLGQGTPNHRQGFETRGAGNDRLQVVTNRASQMPDGMAVTEEDLGTLSLTAFPFSSDFPLYYQRWNGDGTATTYTMNFTPGSIDDIVLTVNGVLQTLTTQYTVNLTTRQITFTTGNLPAADAKIVALIGIKA